MLLMGMAHAVHGVLIAPGLDETVGTFIVGFVDLGLEGTEVRFFFFFVFLHLRERKTSIFIFSRSS